MFLDDTSLDFRSTQNLYFAH